MKPILEHLPRKNNESFVIEYFDYSYFPTPWHYHPEYEIVLVLESTGKRYIGDNINTFIPGDLIILGSNLPHTYKNDESYYDKKSTKRAKSIVIHFSENSFGENFFKLPETQSIKELLNSCFNGFCIKGKENERIQSIMKKMLKLKGIHKWKSLLEILTILSQCKNLEQVSHSNIQHIDFKDSIRITKVIDYILLNFNNKIILDDVAKLTNMTKTSFSRFFIKHTRKSFTEFLLDVRLSNACKILINKDLSISEICFESGFNNLSNFNRQFKSHIKLSPKEYKKQFKKISN